MKTLSITGLCVLLSTAAMAQYGAGTVHGYGYDMYGSYRSYTLDFATDAPRMLWHRRGDIGVYAHRRPHGHAALNAY